MVEQNEMSELVRLCALDFLTGEILVDTYVDPEQRVVAWRSKFSGVTKALLKEMKLQGRTVDGWQSARELLWQHIDEDTILIGHSLNYDLRVLGMIHTQVVDSAIVTKGAVGEDCNRSWALKTLCQQLLGREIQAKTTGHDCLEDTFAAREILLWCLQHPKRLSYWADSERNLITKKKAEKFSAKRGKDEVKEMGREKAATEQSSVVHDDLLEPTRPVTDNSDSLYQFNFDSSTMDPAPNPYGEIVEVRKLPIKEYVVSERSFTKRELLPEQLQKGPDGKPWPWKWGKERLLNEANALNLVRKYTSIPVPKVLDYGIDDMGRTFVTMERVYGITLESIGEECRMPSSGRKAHILDGECKTCADIANAIADSFITNYVLPQLQQLRSYVTGLDGFVLPPPRIVETVPRAAWQPITSDVKKFVFIHGDFARHNIMVSPKTLEVNCIFDWEHAGYFPPELEVDAWRMKHSEYFQLFLDKERIQRELELIGVKDGFQRV